MRRHAIPARASVPPRASALPRFIIPCPFCAGQMVVATVEPSPIDGRGEDITHRCAACGTAVTQTIAPPGKNLRRRAQANLSQ
jgi:transcription elongation factor Elf1